MHEKQASPLVSLSRSLKLYVALSFTSSEIQGMIAEATTNKTSGKIGANERLQEPQEAEEFILNESMKKRLTSLK